MKAGSKFRVEVRQLQRYMTKAVARDGLTFSQPHLLPGLLADGLDASKVCGVGRLHQNAVRLDILDERPDDLRSGVKMGIVPARGGGGGGGHADSVSDAIRDAATHSCTYQWMPRSR